MAVIQFADVRARSGDLSQRPLNQDWLASAVAASLASRMAPLHLLAASQAVASGRGYLTVCRRRCGQCSSAFHSRNGASELKLTSLLVLAVLCRRQTHAQEFAAQSATDLTDPTFPQADLLPSHPILLLLSPRHRVLDYSATPLVLTSAPLSLLIELISDYIQQTKRPAHLHISVVASKATHSRVPFTPRPFTASFRIMPDSKLG